MEKTRKHLKKGTMSLRRELLGLFLLLLALLLFILGAQRVLTPKRLDYGATWGMYLKEPENTVDVLFFGSSLAYCDISPGAIYDETGVTSYVMAGPEQSFSITYRYLAESLRTQHPKIVCIEAGRIAAPANNRSLKVNLTYMPWTENRLVPTFEDAAENERAGLLFPLYAYHDRWDDLTAEDWRLAVTGYSADPMAGYTPLDRVAPAEAVTYAEDTDLSGYEEGLAFAEKIVTLCREEGIRPVFFFSPAAVRQTPEITEQIRGDLTALGADFIDFNDDLSAMGLDLARDFGDNQHTNLSGAEKFSRYFAGKLTQMGLGPTEGEDEALWQDRVRQFEERLHAASEKAAAQPADGAGEGGGEE